MKVTPIGTIEVIPIVPDEIRDLKDLAYNYRWTWDGDIASLFRDLDPGLWEKSGRNPVTVLREISSEKLHRMASDHDYLARYRRCVDEARQYESAKSWYETLCGSCPKNEIVYFSMEYGINENLPVYSGGLGVLSGDHIKSASDLGVPMVAIGLAYRQGYFQQRLSAEGYQTEQFPLNDFDQLGVTPVMDAEGKRIVVGLPFPGRTVHVAAWQAKVGRISLYLLDTDVPENDAADRRITHVLYGGDKETRIQQEIVLGVGGVEMVKRLGHEVTVCHMNEGHSAFIQLARILHSMKDHGLTAREAIQLVAAGTIFTTHTPVPAGIDQFPADLMDKYFGHMYAQFGLSRNEVLALGSREPGVPAHEFNMAILALRTANYSNGVSRLHADVSRNLWKESFPALPYDEIPIDYVTNGIHLTSWMSGDMTSLLDKHLGPAWRTAPDHKDVWEEVKNIPDEDLWSVRNRASERLVQYTRHRTAEYRTRIHGIEPTPKEAEALLDPNILTIGFARRFATYKRATLLLRYPERLLALLKDKDRPIQIIFSGKAHPQDDAGKSLIHDILYFARSEGVEHRLVFIENYGLGVARYMVQGVDVWLNTPRRPLEASGTSGMKVICNGGLNLSILDGWWDEAYEPGLGWAVGSERIMNDDHAQDEFDARSLYNQLENHIVPLFYDRDNGIPRNWLAMVKRSMAGLVPRFNTHRMVKEYAVEYYIPALYFCHRLAGDGKVAVKDLAKWRDFVYANWNSLKIDGVRAQTRNGTSDGTEMTVEAAVTLGEFKPEDVEVQLYYGPLRGDGSIAAAGVMPLDPEASASNTLFKGTLTLPESGRYGYTVRVIPSHPLLDNPLKMGLVHWAQGSSGN